MHREDHVNEALKAAFNAQTRLDDELGRRQDAESAGLAMPHALLALAHSNLALVEMLGKVCEELYDRR